MSAVIWQTAAVHSFIPSTFPTPWINSVNDVLLTCRRSELLYTFFSPDLKWYICKSCLPLYIYCSMYPSLLWFCDIGQILFLWLTQWLCVQFLGLGAFYGGFYVWKGHFLVNKWLQTMLTFLCETGKRALTSKMQPCAATVSIFPPLKNFITHVSTVKWKGNVKSK